MNTFNDKSPDIHDISALFSLYDGIVSVATSRITFEQLVLRLGRECWRHPNELAKTMQKVVQTDAKRVQKR